MPPNAPQATSNYPPRLSLPAAAGLAALTVLLALPRFAHTTPDSAHYVALVAYFQGDVARQALQTPFALRWALPWLAAWIPGVTPGTALAFCSVIATVLAYGCFARILDLLLTEAGQWRRGMAVLVISFPTVNYGSAVLTDSAGFLVLAAAAWALVARRYLWVGVLAATGVWVRESTLLVLPMLWLFVLLERDRRGLAAAAGATLAAGAAALAARWWFADLPAYFWTPDWDRFTANLARPVSWATVLLTLVPVALFALPGLWRWRELPPRTRHFVIAAGLPALALAAYSLVAAYMSGRFCWPLYLALIPLAAAGRRGERS